MIIYHRRCLNPILCQQDYLLEESPEYPAWRQATLASFISQPLSHTEPHWLLLQISTRPSLVELPATSLISPCVHAAKTIKAHHIRFAILMSLTGNHRCTNDPSILQVCAVMSSKSTRSTVKKSKLITITHNIVNEDWSRALAKNCLRLRYSTWSNTAGISYLHTSRFVLTIWRKSQLSTGYTSLFNTPQIITHSAPHSIYADLNTTL